MTVNDDRFDALMMAQEAARGAARKVPEYGALPVDLGVALALVSIAQDMRQIRTTLQELAPREGSPIRSLWIRVRR